MEARNTALRAGLVLAVALGMWSLSYALPNDAAAQQARLDVLLKLKAGETVTEAEWDALRSLHRAAVPRRPLDTGGEDCASATVISGLPFTDSGTTTGASDEYNYYCPWEWGGSPDVVYAYTPTTNHGITVDLCESTYDSKVFVYAGTCEGDPVACNDDACGSVYGGHALASRVDCIPVTAGTTYYIVVDGFFEWESGNYVLQVAACDPCTQAPAHDQPGNAKVVPSLPYSDTDDNTCARHDCDNYLDIYADVWYRFTLTEPGDVTIDFCGTTPPLDFAALALMQCGTDCAPLFAAEGDEYATCGDFNPTVRWRDVPAGTYCYPVLSLVGSGQEYTINIRGAEPIASDYSGFIRLTDVRPTHRRLQLIHESGFISRVAFTGLCPGTTGQAVSHADSAWNVLPNGDGNDGDSVIFVADYPLTAGSIGTFVLRHPACTSDIHWVVGSSSGVIPGSLMGASPVGLVIHQNIPNPFNPSTTIRFDLSETAHVRAAVFNVMGQEVTVLADGTREAGPHTLRFDASGLTSGVYVCRIDVPGNQQKLKMLLVK